ncbi:TM2 domain protein [compost metagenome]
MPNSHKNKTLATLLATLFGGIGLHRFYLYGKKDIWAWVHILCFPFSIFAGFIAALVFGLTPDEKWDAQHNAHSGRTSDSGWAVIVLVVLTFALGSTALIATIARGFDLYLTGGAFG